MAFQRAVQARPIGESMNDHVRVVRYQKADREDVFRFLRVSYSRDESSRLIRQWDWKYDANPFNGDAEPYILLLKDGPQIVGMLGTISLRVVIRGEEHWISHSCDWVVRPDYRDRRVARRLVERHRADKPLRFSWQNEISYQKSQRRPDTSTTRVVPLVKPLDVAHILLQVTGNRILSRAGGIVLAGAHRVTRPLRARPIVPAVAIAEMPAFDERFDALWQRVREHHPVMLVRDRAYLDWRFRGRPDARYTVLAATKGADLVGYLVLRSADDAGVSWGYLVDFLVEDESAAVFSLLVEHAADSLLRQCVKAISCRATAPAYRRTLYRHAFFPFFWGRQGYLRVNVNAPDPGVQVLRDVQRWHLTMGDGDLEMAF
jgi:hypothetical protein